MRRSLAFLSTASACLLVGPAYAQFGRGPGDWMTSGGDAQRSSWVRTDPKINPQSMAKPGFALDWKIKLANEPSTPVTLDRYIGYRGFRSLTFMGSTTGNLTVVDSDLGRIEWQKTLSSGLVRGAGACGGGMTANVTRPTITSFGNAPAGRGGGGGRGAAARSGVGAPGEGAVTIAEIAARGANGGRGGFPGRGPAPGRGAAANAAANAFFDIYSPRVSLVDALTNDGKLHLMWVSNGNEPKPGIPFLPPNANAHGLIVIDNVAYVTTSQGCGGVANGVWALDLPSQQVTSWKASGDVAGSEGPVFGTDGTVYVATTTGELAALEPKTLAPKAVHHLSGQGFVSSPVLFDYKDKAFIAAVAQDGSIHVLDTAALEGADVAQSGASPGLKPESLASWEDEKGTRWILGASKGSILAWRLVDQNGTPSLQSGWTSRDMNSPMAPLVVNGVVFAVAAGDRATPAVLYAMDGETGKDLWNSGKTITSPVRKGGFSGSGSQIYLGTSDGTIYAFGFPIEH